MLFVHVVIIGASAAFHDCLDPMFILTWDREYDENPIITSRTMTLTIEQRQVDCIDWNIYYNTIQLDIIRYCVKRYYTIRYDIILYYFYNISIAMDVSDITRRALFFLQGMFFYIN